MKIGYSRPNTAVAKRGHSGRTLASACIVITWIKGAYSHRGRNQTFEQICSKSKRDQVLTEPASPALTFCLFHFDLLVGLGFGLFNLLLATAVPPLWKLEIWNMFCSLSKRSRSWQSIASNAIQFYKLIFRILKRGHSRQDILWFIVFLDILLSASAVTPFW
jgi:hypothetical protein